MRVKLILPGRWPTSLYIVLFIIYIDITHNIDLYYYYYQIFHSLNVTHCLQSPESFVK